MASRCQGIESGRTRIFPTGFWKIISWIFSRVRVRVRITSLGQNHGAGESTGIEAVYFSYFCRNYSSFRLVVASRPHIDFGPKAGAVSFGMGSYTYVVRARRR